MKKGPATVIIVILALLASFFGYRSWKQKADQDLSAQRERALEAGKADAEKRASDATEAARLAQQQASLEADENARKLAELHSEQAVNEDERKKAALEVAAEKERLEKAKAATEQEAAQLAAERAKAETDADAARQAAMQKLAELDQQKRDSVDRETARLAALKRQQEMEGLLALRGNLSHTVYPNDYKRREHYYLNIDMINNEIQSENEANSKPSPLK